MVHCTNGHFHNLKGYDGHFHNVKGYDEHFHNLQGYDEHQLDPTYKTLEIEQKIIFLALWVIQIYIIFTFE